MVPASKVGSYVEQQAGYYSLQNQETTSVFVLKYKNRKACQ